MNEPKRIREIVTTLLITVGFLIIEIWVTYVCARAFFDLKNVHYLPVKLLMGILGGVLSIRAWMDLRDIIIDYRFLRFEWRRWQRNRGRVKSPVAVPSIVDESYESYKKINLQ